MAAQSIDERCGPGRPDRILWRRLGAAGIVPAIVPAVFGILPLSTGYQILGLLHILAAICAFGPLFLYPKLQRSGETQAMAWIHMRFVFPALVLLWVLGMGMAGVESYDMANTPWMTASIVVWLVTLAVSWFLIRPAITDTSDSARGKLAAGVGITHLLLLVALWMMIFQPGDTVFKL